MIFYEYTPKEWKEITWFMLWKRHIIHIVPGNKGRVLDGWRTPGFIEKYDDESAMFIWRIADFEDKGKCWEVPAEEILAYQFEKTLKNLHSLRWKR